MVENDLTGGVKSLEKNPVNRGDIPLLGRFQLFLMKDNGFCLLRIINCQVLISMIIEEKTVHIIRVNMGCGKYIKFMIFDNEEGKEYVLV